MQRSPDADYWHEQLDLAPHPEGGHYAETYESEVPVGSMNDVGGDGSARATASSIYYLLERGEYSAFHRIDADELWHFYRGDPLTLYVLDDGLETVTLGVDRFQAVMPADTWFAAELEPTERDSDVGYALVGCDVTPAFEEANYELADASLVEEYATYGDLVERFLRPPEDRRGFD